MTVRPFNWNTSMLKVDFEIRPDDHRYLLSVISDARKSARMPHELDALDRLADAIADALNPSDQPSCNVNTPWMEP